MQGIAGVGYFDSCVVPIIENTARECELTDRLRQAIKEYPDAHAVLVRRHGVYVWGSSWIQVSRVGLALVCLQIGHLAEGWLACFLGLHTASSQSAVRPMADLPACGTQGTEQQDPSVANIVLSGRL